jgi:hypothetical protein
MLYKNRRSHPLKTLQAHLGSPDRHNTYEAETMGAILAPWILENTPATIGKTVSLYTDNQALVKSLPHPKASSGQYLLSCLSML